jgi:hypothetical protein
MFRTGAHYREQFELLGIDYHRLDECVRVPDARIANERLDALKRDIKAAWKRAAFELHPDRTGGDPEKEAQFKRLAVFMQDVDKFRITPRSRGPEWNRVRNYPMNVRWVDMTSTTSSSGASFGDAFVSFVVNGRRVTFE